jgi:site-specific recombinase XerD
VLAPLKTDASHAVLPMPQVTTDALLEHQKQQRIQRMKSKVWLDDAELVFTTNVGTAIEPRNMNRAWDALCARAGIARKITIHDLRHACATYLVAEGVDLRTVQGQLRHTRMTTTQIYLHALEDVQRDAADKMDVIIGRLRAQVPGAKGASSS